MATGDAPDDPLIGRIIAGRHRMISRLGVGGMGTAYRAWDEKAGVPVVIKIPKKAFLEDPTFAERFQREIRLLQGLSHPHIVPITDVGEHGGVPFVVMRFLPGGSLSNRRLRDENGKVRPNPPGMLCLWLPAIAEALDHIHAQGVVHRDVKPANIFFDAFWGAYLGDFGIAKVVEESDAFDKEQTLTATHMGIGTQEYMAPEQFAPKAVVDGRADQYALAVMVYEMLAGSRPFTGSTAHLIVEVTTQQVPPLRSRRSDLPTSLVDTVHRGLARKPEERFTTCGDFARAALRDVPPLGDEPGVARLLCPNCTSILKLPMEAAGRQGRCPKCRTNMKVADDLGALWLLDEARRQNTITRPKEMSGPSPGEAEAPIIAYSEDESLETFEPLSSTSPIVKAVRSHKKPTALPVFGVAAALLAAAVLILVLVGGGRDSKQPGRDAKRQQDLAEASADAEAVPARNATVPLALKVKFLADLPARIAEAHAYRNSNRGQTVGGNRYAKTLYVHPERESGRSSVVFSIEGKYDELSGAVGILDVAKHMASPQVFRIVGDGEELWRSSPIQKTGKGEQFRIAVSGVKTLELHADAPGPTQDAHCVWIDPQVVALPALTLEEAQKLLAEEKTELVLDGPVALTPDAAKVLAAFQGKYLVLEGVAALSTDVAEVLAEFKGNGLALNGLHTLAPEAARSLAAFQGTLSLCVRTLSAESAEALAAWPRRFPACSLKVFTELSPEAAKALADYKGKLVLNGLSPESARALAAFQGDLVLDRTTLSVESAQALAGFKGALQMVGSTPSPEVARALAGLEGEVTLSPSTLSPDLARSLASSRATSLSLATLSALSPDAARALSTFEGVLYLNELDALPPDVAEALSGDQAGVALDGLSTISPEAARGFHGFHGELCLRGVTALSPELARALAQLDCSCITLDGVTELSPEVARAFAAYRGELDLSGLTALAPDVMNAFTDFRGVLHLGGLTSLSPEDARTLAKSDFKGTLVFEHLIHLPDEVRAALRANPRIKLPE